MPTKAHKRTCSKIVTWGFCEPFLERFVEYLEANTALAGKDLRRVAVVFGGRRPALFVKRLLALHGGKGFYPPRFFTIDEFIAHLAAQKKDFQPAKDLDLCYAVYQLVREHTPGLCAQRKTFASFLPWTREILKFLDLLDLEDIKDDRLRHIKENAEIGYAVPQDINDLLTQLAALRRVYHQYMEQEKIFSRGYQYRQAAEVIHDLPLDEFEQILFCNFFSLNRCEEAVMQDIYRRDKATFFMQGDERRWPVFKNFSRTFDCPILEGEEVQNPRFDLKLYQGFDTHSQIALVREVLEKIKDPSKTVIVLPDPDHLIPLLIEIAPVIKDFNVSMGYPLKRSSLYSLFEFIFQAQRSRTSAGYYTRDYLRALRHPLIKNLKGLADERITRVLVHKIEEILTGLERTGLSGQAFIDPRELADHAEVYSLTEKVLQGMELDCPQQRLKALLDETHDLLFFRWEAIANFDDFAAALAVFMQAMLEKSFMDRYPLNLKIAEKILTIKDDLLLASFRHEPFTQEEIFKIFDAHMRHEIVAFSGSPLKGLQILGLFETRALNFDNVIVLDVNEGVLPKLNIYEPLIPREVMLSLNLDRLEQEEEIQRYQFMRLLSSAKEVHLIYQEGRDKERSRFIEELLWEEEKKQKQVHCLPVTQAYFDVEVKSSVLEIPKTGEMIETMKRHCYSASSINTYLRNPVEFYYRYCLGLQEKEDLLDEPENRQVGTFIHQLLEETFKPFVGRKPVVDAAFRKYFQKICDQRFEETLGRGLKSRAFFLKAVLDARLKRFLDNEAENPERAVREILFIEKPFEDVIDLPCGETRFVYKLDRVDRLEDGTVLLLDYKTGSLDPMPKGLEYLEKMDLTRETIYENIKSFQIPLYFFYLEKYFGNEKVNAAFYNLRTLELTKFLDAKRGLDRARIKQVFVNALDFVVREILDPHVPFREGEEPFVF